MTISTVAVAAAVGVPAAALAASTADTSAPLLHPAICERLQHGPQNHCRREQKPRPGRQTSAKNGPGTAISPLGLTTGPDGDLWFTEYAAGKIARLSSSGVLTEYAIPTADGGPADIVAGPGGDLWFTEAKAGKIGRTTESGFITEYALPAANATPWGITAGTDGRLWFTDARTHTVTSMTTSGSITEYPIPPAASSGPRLVPHSGPGA